MSNNDMAKARAGKAKVIEARKKTLAERVQEILASDRVDPELKRKLRYCQDQISSGRTDYIVDTRKALIREAERTYLRLALDNLKT